MEKKDIKIVVAAHKPYQMPEDDMYIPLHVGAEGKTNIDGTPLDLGYQKDNEGDNISVKTHIIANLLASIMRGKIFLPIIWDWCIIDGTLEERTKARIRLPAL